MIWVVDASVAVRWFLKDEGHPNADAVLYTLIDRPESFAVPELFCFEVYAVLCRLHPSGHDVFIKGMIPILNSGVFRQPMTERLANQAARFVKKGLTGYDATYVALAT
ncbi:MAG: type II toxin-antitoxin system VapC family toxin, partial [Deltaproteobacteria bacterium]|nr:type II toxin-antitoxin system VapC family toxin [Deltaproteobacteria bacterium]